MGFSNVLKLYLNKTQSTAKELSAASGISASALSRYRSGKRIPDQEQIEKLICGFVKLASEKKTELDEAIIRNAFSEFTEKPKFDYNAIIKNLNTAIEALDISVSGLSRALSFDSSYLSRIRTGQRKPADLDKFLIETAGYIARTNSPLAIAGLIGQHAEELVPVDRCALKLCSWLNSKTITTLPVLKIPTAEPLISDSNDWYARFLTVKNTFSSRVGQISNSALSRGIIAYDESLTEKEREHYLQEVETLAILTGLEIDSAKSGIKPDLSEYIEHSKVTKSLFLKYKAIVDSDRFSKWYDESKYMKLKKYFEKVDWNKVTSNLEKLPYYAFNLEKHTEKALVKPVPDENLFEFANDHSWKEKLNPDTLKKVESIIADYEEALKRVQQIRHTSSEMKRKTDISRILFARCQETEYSVDELYAAFDDITPSDIQKARKYLSENMWQFTPSDEREPVIYSLFASAKIYR